MVHLKKNKKKPISCPSLPTHICTLEEIRVFFSHSFFYRYTIKYNLNFPPVILEGTLGRAVLSSCVNAHVSFASQVRCVSFLSLNFKTLKLQFITACSYVISQNFAFVNMT